VKNIGILGKRFVVIEATNQNQLVKEIVRSVLVVDSIEIELFDFDGALHGNFFGG